MKPNVGSVDRAIRIVLGVALLALMFLLEGPWKFIGLIGLVPLATGIFRFCPLYPVFGINTCKTERRDMTAKRP